MIVTTLWLWATLATRITSHFSSQPVSPNNSMSLKRLWTTRLTYNVTKVKILTLLIYPKIGTLLIICWKGNDIEIKYIKYRIVQLWWYHLEENSVKNPHKLFAYQVHYMWQILFATIFVICLKSKASLKATPIFSLQSPKVGQTKIMIMRIHSNHYVINNGIQCPSYA